MLTTVLADPTGYGRIIRGDDNGIDRIVEQGDGTAEELAVSEVNAGVYALGVAGLRDRLAALSIENAQGEKYLTDIVAALRAAGSSVSAVPAAQSWMVEGINDRAQLASAAGRLNALIVRGWQLAGVSILDPATTWIDLTVTLAPDVEILPGTQLKGATKVETGAVIGPDTTLVDCEIGERAIVKRTDATLAVIGAGCIRRPLRLPPARHRPRSRRQDRHLRRDQELHDRRRLQGAPPVLHRRHHRRHRIQRRRRHHHGQLRRGEQAQDSGRIARPHRARTTSSWPPLGLATEPIRRRGQWCARMCRRAPWPSTWPRNATSKAGWPPTGRAPMLPGRQRRAGTVERDHPARDQDRRREASCHRQRSCPPRAGREHRRRTRHRGRADRRAHLRQRRALRPLRRERARLRRLRHPVAHRPDQPVAHGAADHGRRPQARLRQAHHRRLARSTPTGVRTRRTAVASRSRLGSSPTCTRLPAPTGSCRSTCTPRRSRASSTAPSTTSSPCRCCSSTSSAPSTPRHLTVVSPDMGRVRVADIWSDKLGAPLAIIHKRRDPRVPNQVSVHEIVGDVRGPRLPAGRRPDRHGPHHRGGRRGTEGERRRRGHRRGDPRGVLRPGAELLQANPDIDSVDRHRHASARRSTALRAADGPADRPADRPSDPRGLR